MQSPSIRGRAMTRVAMMASFIEANIADGTWRAGDKLPTERELVQRFGIARNTLRKHLRELEACGVVMRRVGSGTFVVRSAAQAREKSGDNLLTRIQGASPAEIMEVRLMIEPQAIELAASRATLAHFDRMDEYLGRSEAATTTAEFEEWDGALHLEILLAARNQLLIDIYHAINGARHQAEWGKLKERSLTPANRAAYERQHRSIIAALRQRDSQCAAAALREHLLTVRGNLFGRDT